MRKRIVLLSVSVLLAGCAPSIFINKEYSQTDFQNQKVNVAIIDTITFDYNGSMDNEFPSENRSENVKSFIENAIVKALKDSSVFQAVAVAKPDCDSFQNVKLQWKDSSTFTISVPSPYCVMPSDSNSLWLLVEQPKVESKPWVQIVTFYMVPVAAIPHKPLTITSRFVYWDAVQKKPVAWGKASGFYDQGPAVTMTNWQVASANHGFSMIKKSPFVRKPKNLK